MKRNILILSAVFGVIAVLLSCSQEQAPKPWIPALEETSFIYFADTVDKALKSVNETDESIRLARSSKALDALHKTENFLLKLKLYDIPMTEFRQLVYDADRLFYLGRKEQAKGNLKKGKEILLTMVDSLGSPAGESLDELLQSIEKLEIALDHAPEKVDGILKALGERVNLLLLKGDLVMAGTTFKARK